jgi:hypothetical protein
MDLRHFIATCDAAVADGAALERLPHDLPFPSILTFLTAA